MRIRISPNSRLAAALSACLLFICPIVSAEAPTSQPARVAEPASQPAGIVYPGMPIDDADAVLLTHYARRGIRSGFKGKPVAGDPYVPPSLEGREGVIHVSLWRSGAMLATGISARLPVVEATLGAAFDAGKALKTALPDEKWAGADCNLVLEWIGPDELIDPPYFIQDTTFSPHVLKAMLPWIHAVGVSYDGKSSRIRASEIIQHHYSPDFALALAERKVGVDLEVKKVHPEKIRYFRCETIHLWQEKARATPIRLMRGERLVLPDAVNKESLEAAIDRMGNYLVYRQNLNGAFSHEYIPSSDKYVTVSDALVQLRTLGGLSRLADHRLDAKMLQGVFNGVAAFSQYLEDLNFQIATQDGAKVAPSGGRILFIPGHEDHLESTAYLHLAMSTSPAHSRYKAELQELSKTLLFAELSDGSMRLILGKLPEDAPTPKEDRAGATALAALAQQYALTKDANIDTTMLETLAYYSSRETDLSADAAAWLIRAYAQQYIQTGQPRYEAFVFMMADRFAGLQLTPENSVYPELWGAITPSKTIPVGARTGLYVSALSDALRVARRTGDSDRVHRYERAVSLGARFILQLEFSEIGAYYVRSKIDVLGGIRSELWDAGIKADHCAIGVCALIDARNALFK